MLEKSPRFRFNGRRSTVEEYRVPSKKALSESQKKAIVTRIDGALARVVALHGPETLHECRALFRKRVPLHLRSYVAAALLFDGSAGPMKAQAAGSGRGARRPGGQEPVGMEESRRGLKGEQKQASRQEPKRGPTSGQERGAKRARPPRASLPGRRRQRFYKRGQAPAPLRARHARYAQWAARRSGGVYRRAARHG